MRYYHKGVIAPKRIEYSAYLPVRYYHVRDFTRSFGHVHDSSLCVLLCYAAYVTSTLGDGWRSLRRQVYRTLANGESATTPLRVSGGCGRALFTPEKRDGSQQRSRA